MTDQDEHRAEAETLALQGYRRTSSKYGMLSRVDREDWQEFMAKTHAPWDINEGRAWVYGLGTRAADQYRRCYSRDKITVSTSISKFVPSSSHDTIGYVQRREI